MTPSGIAQAAGAALLVAAGLWLVGSVLLSALHTVVVPRGERPKLTALVFLSVRRSLDLPLRRASAHRREQLLQRYAPVALVLLAGTWAVLVIIGFTPLHWALGELNWIEALQVSGSSLTTLGFVSADPTPSRLIEILEALIGLGLVGLLISFLPTIYNSYSQREILVAQLSSRAGQPPSAANFVIRQQSIRGLENLEETWAEWEDWFSFVEESHSSYPSLIYFRSGEGRSWLTAAGALLDSAAMIEAAVDIPNQPSAALCLRSGFLCLREVAAQFLIQFDPSPQPDDPIRVSRSEFDECWNSLEAAGVPLVADQDQAWRDWSGWRVNYEDALLGLCALAEPPWALWSSDRVEPVKRRIWATIWRLVRTESV
jgi:hypothetical protein